MHSSCFQKILKDNQLVNLLRLSKASTILHWKGQQLVENFSWGFTGARYHLDTLWIWTNIPCHIARAAQNWSIIILAASGCNCAWSLVLYAEIDIVLWLEVAFMCLYQHTCNRWICHELHILWRKFWQPNLTCLHPDCRYTHLVTTGCGKLLKENCSIIIVLMESHNHYLLCFPFAMFTV